MLAASPAGVNQPPVERRYAQPGADWDTNQNGEFRYRRGDQRHNERERPNVESRHERLRCHWIRSFPARPGVQDTRSLPKSR